MPESVYFQTPGIIEDFAFDTFGLSVKKNDSPIGRFGTGMKYCLAIVLARGGKVTIWKGTEPLHFSLEKATVRGEEVSYVVAGDRRLPFTTHLGSHWDMWMAFREVYANTKDEKGSVGLLEDHFPEEGKTTIEVEHDDFFDAYRNRDSIILPDDLEVVFESPYVTCYRGMNSIIYYRGVRAGDAKNNSLYTYSVKIADITEDRTFRNMWGVEQTIAKAIMTHAPSSVIRSSVKVGSKMFEESLDYDQVLHSKTFIDTVKEMSDSGVTIVESAIRTLNNSLSDYERILLEHDIELTDEEEAELLIALEKAKAVGFPSRREDITVKRKLPKGNQAMRNDSRIFLSYALWSAADLLKILILHGISRDTGHDLLSKEMTSFLVDRLIDVSLSVTTH